MINFRIFFIFSFIICYLFSIQLYSKYDRITKLYRINYTTHLYSYDIPYEWYLRQIKDKNIFISYAGSTSSDEFAYYRFINIYQQLSPKFSFQYEHFTKDNPDYTKKNNILKLNYSFGKYDFGLIGEVARDKENNDFGFEINYKNDNSILTLRKLNKIFQHNKRAKRPLEKEYNKIPVEYNLIYLTENLLNGKLDILFDLDFSNKSNYTLLSDISSHYERYFDLNNHFNWNVSFAENLIHSISFTRVETKDFYLTSQELFKADIFKNMIKINNLSFNEKISLGINYMINKTNHTTVSIDRYKKQSVTGLFEYSHFANDKLNIYHSLYSTWTWMELNNQAEKNGYFIKYVVNSEFYLNNNSRIVLNLGLEKEDTKQPAFGGGCMQLLISF